MTKCENAHYKHILERIKTTEYGNSEQPLKWGNDNLEGGSNCAPCDLYEWNS